VRGTAAAQRSDPNAAVALLAPALELWRGRALADIRDAPFAVLAGQRLEQERLTAVETLVEARLRLGDHRALVPELEALIAESPFRERFHAQLMLALYRSGRQAEALAASWMLSVRPLATRVYALRRRIATITVAVLAGLLFGHVILGANGMMVYKQKRMEFQSLQKQIVQEQKENELYTQRIQSLKTDEKAIEKEAREQLRYARPGEYVYVPPAAANQPPPATRSTSPWPTTTPATSPTPSGSRRSRASCWPRYRGCGWRPSPTAAPAAALARSSAHAARPSAHTERRHRRGARPNALL